MSLALVRKELRDHRWVVCAAALLSGLSLLGLLLISDKLGGRFGALCRFVGFIATPNALLLSSRLFVREYAGRTQLFLETLPIGRGVVFTTKWLLGCAGMLLLTYFAFVVNLRWVRRTEVVAGADARATLGCVLAFTLALWSVSVVAAMLGRYRYAAWLGLALFLGALVSVAGIPLASLAPFRLLGEDVAMARTTEVAPALASVLAIAAVATACAAMLALCGSGAMASALAQRMTTRERVFVLVSLIAGAFLVATLEKKPVKPPFVLADAEFVRSSRASVGVMHTGDMPQAAAHALATMLHADADSLIATLSLALDPPPSIFVLPQRGLDRHVVQRAGLDKSDGIVLRAAPDVSREKLRAHVIHALLGEQTFQRALREDRHVLLDGFSAWWVLQGDPDARERWWLRAASAPGTLHAGSLSAWDTTSERLGTCIADAVAFAAVDVLDRELGRQRLLELARATFARPPDDLRVIFERAPSVLLERAGVSWPRLAALVESARSHVRAEHAAQLASRPDLRAEVHARHRSDRGHTLEASLNQSAEFWVSYAVLSPWAHQPGETPRLDVRGRHAVVPLSPPRGSRAFVAVETDDVLLGCPVRLAASRIGLP
jgi:putative SOS response-associated peptidase YedK